ncbi:hypothetical protein [Burkholderia plantarii]|uniref:hypothetical protein n=1 Tax=Burkholderia plantarii TaxID=41899 RepID=UPI0018DC45BF|nr:hypothetical protein [Burkholderia plantarii]MBI0325978.1 hypothetical protein [Burkholderia plantarii]
MNPSIVIQRRIGRVGAGNVPVRVSVVRHGGLLPSLIARRIRASRKKTRNNAAGTPSNQDG